MKHAFPIWYALFPLAVLVGDGFVLRYNWGWWRMGNQFELWIPLEVWALVNVLAMGAAMACATGIDYFVSAHSAIQWKKNGTWGLVSMRNIDGVSGSVTGGMFLLSGYVGSQQFYSYYTKNNDGSFAPRKWEADRDTAVYEEDRADGSLVTYDIAFVHEWVNWFATPSNRRRGEFHIPNGSLKKAFSLQ